MKNFTRYKFLLLLPVLVAFLAYGVQAQCPTIPNATYSSTDVTCFGANDGTVTVELGDGTGPFNYFLFDLNQGQFLLTATKTVIPANKVVFSNLPASDYIVQVRKPGCANINIGGLGITVNEPVTLVLNVISQTNISGCFGEATGSFQAAASGGNGGYTYSFNGGTFGNTTSFTNLTAGTYTIDVKDSKNCTESVSVTITQPAQLAISLTSQSDPDCNGNTTGSISVAATGGTPTYEFSVNGGAFAPGSGTFANLAPGSYNIQVRDSKGCTAILPTVTLTNPPILTISLTSQTDITGCFGDATGEMVVAASGGTPAYEFSINGGAFASASTFSNLTAGSYSIQVRDSKGCTASLPAITITQPAQLAIGLTSKTDITGCFGEATGEIVVLASGGTPGYEFSINGGTFTSVSSFTNLSAGDYTVQVRDSKGCMTTLPTVIITQPAALQANVSSQSNPFCFGANDGIISTTVSGGTSPYTYSVNGGAFASGTGTFSNLVAGTYDIQVRDANGCTVTLPTVTLTEPALLAIALNSRTDIENCFGDATGEIVTTVSGGTPSYEYSVNGGAFTSGTGTFSNLTAGSYTISVRDANGCTTTLNPVTISQPTQLTINITSKTDIAGCFGDSTGEITVSATGGTPTYEYSINGATFASTNVFDNLSAGDYNIQVRDSKGCLATLPTVTIIQPSEISINLTAKQDVTCKGGSDGSITVSATGGTPAYEFSINGSVFSGANVFNNLIAGDYTIQVRDSKGCIATLPVTTVSEPAVLTPILSSKTDITGCFGDATGEIVVSATGGTSAYEFSINGGTFTATSTFSNLLAGNYTIQVRDANGCTATLDLVTITQPDPLLVSLTSKTDITTCFGDATGEIVVSATGGTTPYTYSVNGGAFATGTGTFSNLIAGTYTIQVRDANGCTASLATITISQPSAVSISLTSKTDITSCFGDATGSITVSASGGTPAYEFSINGGAFAAASSFTNLTAGSYSIQVKDSKGCTATLAPVTITQPTALQANISSQTNPSCFGATDGSISLATSGGTSPYTYSLNGGAFATGTGIFNNLIAGTYAIQVRDANGCIVTLPTVTLTEPAVLAISLTSTTDVTGCFGEATGEIVISVSGGTPTYEYSVNGAAFTSGTGTFSNLTAGTYNIQVRDANGCTTSLAPVTITQPDALSISLTSKTDITSCAGDATGEIVVSVNGGTSPYTYSVNGGTFAIGTGTFSNLVAGTYSIQVRDSKGCTAGLPTVTITQPTQLTVSLISKTDPACDGTASGSILVAAAGGTSPYTFAINGGIFTSSASFNNLTAGTYSIQVKDANSCIATLPDVILTAPAALTLTLGSQTNPACNGDSNGSISVMASGGTMAYMYSLNGGSFVSGNSFTNLPAGTYNITVRDANNCTATLSDIVLSAPASVLASITSTVNGSCFGASDGSITTIVSGGTSPYSYSVNGGAFASGTGTFTSLSAGTYTIAVRDANGCTTTLPATTITAPADLNLNITSQTNIDACSGINSGSITVAASGGTSAYTYSIDGIAFTASNTFSNLAIGTYTLTVKDANNCTDQLTATITATSGTLAASESHADPTCNGATDGSIMIGTVSGGSGSYEYSLDGTTFQDGNTFTGLASGNYTVIVQDQNAACSTTLSVTLANPSAVTAIVSTVNPNACTSANGSITVTASGGKSPYTYSLNGGAFVSGNVFSNLAAGTYSIQVQDANTCPFTVPDVTLTAPSSVTISLISKTDVLCAGTATGNINVSASGGTTPYQYALDGITFTSTATFNNLSAGTYNNITVKDANGCTAVLPVVTITQPSALAISLTASVNPSCSDPASGSITVSVSGGVSPYSYSVNGGTFTAGSGTFSNLTAGTYTIAANDANGCTVNLAPVTLSASSSITATVSKTDPSACTATDGTITITDVSGGTTPYTYSIDGNTFVTTSSFTGLAAGTYIASVKDASGCVFTSSQTLTAASGLTANFMPIGESGCDVNDGLIIVSGVSGASGPYKYYINNAANPSGINNNVFISLAGGNYLLKVEAANGCSFSQTVTITSPCPPPACSITASVLATSTNCNGGNDGTLTVTASGGSGSYAYSVDGSTFKDSNTFANLNAGAYTVTIRDKNDITCTATANATITQPSVITATVTGVNPTGCNTTDGNITVSGVSGGTAPYTYSINGTSFQAATSFSGLGSGNYTITIKDALGCIITQSQTLTSPGVITASVSLQQNVTCNGGNDGSISLTVSGGSGSYQYILNGGAFQNGNSFTGLTAGNYSVTARDIITSCSTSVLATITEPALLTLSLSTKTDVTTCFRDTTGSITVAANGGTSPYQYSLDGTIFVSGSTFNNLPAGTYANITVKDANGCTTILAPVTIIQPAAFAITLTSSANVTCNGADDGQIVVSVAGGTTPYTYSVNGNAFVVGTGTFGNLTAGTYSIQVQDANGCIATLPGITLTQPSALAVSISAITQPTCNGSDGGFTVSASGGTSPYVYAVNGGAFGNNNVFTNLSAGSYNVEVKDANDCITAQIVTLTATGGITSLAINASEETTCGANDGIITVSTVQGGTAPYTYYLNGAVNPAGATNNTFNNLASALYTILVEDANGCTFTQTTTVDDNCTNPVCTLAATFIAQNVTCFGSNNGSITINATGGSGTYEYSLNGSTYQNGAAFLGLTAGTYTATIRDKADNTCTITISNISIAEPALTLSATADSTNITCNGSNDGSINIISVTGGTAPYQYSIDGGNTFFTTNLFNNLAPGTYNPVVQDANGCTIALSAITLTEPVALFANIDASNPSACTTTDGSITVSTVNGGTAPYNYSLDGVNYQSGNTFTELGDGTYNVFIKDANGCVIFQAKTLTSPSGITASAVATPVTCNAGTDGSVAITVTGGSGNYEYSLGGTTYQASNTFANLAAGNYTISVRDITTACLATVSAVVSQPAAVSISVTAQAEPSCHGGNDGSITVIASSGTAPYTYAINGGAFGANHIFANLTAGTYSIQVQDANGCIATLPDATLNQPSALTATVTAQTNITCNGLTDGSFTLTVSGGTGPYTYSVNGNAFTSGTGIFTDLSAGNYSVQVKDNKGCLVTAADVTIIEPALLAISLSTKTDVTTCFGDATGSITVSASGGTSPYQYSIDGTTFVSSTGFTNLSAGIYNSVTVRDANGCRAVLPAVTITQPAALQATISVTSPTNCTAADGSISVSGISGGSGDYEFSIDGTNFQASPTFNNLPNGAYTITIRDKNNISCIITRSITLNGGNSLTATATATHETACLASDGSITVNVSGGIAPYEYFLGSSTTANTNGNIFSNLAPGTYSVRVVSSDNCQFTVSNIGLNAATCTPACNLTARLISTNVLCNGQSNGTVELIEISGGSGSYEFSIDNGINYQDSPIFSNLTSGNYTITVRDKNNLTCTAAFAAPRVGTDFFVSGVIIVNQPPACSNLGGIEFTNVGGGTAPYSFSVDGVNFQSGSVFTNLVSGTYQATIKDANNCQYSASVAINGASPVTATALQTAQITCNGASDAAITITASGGTTPYQYAVNSGVFATSSGVFSNLAAGTYTISVKDANNCIFTLPAVTISEPTAITASISAQANPACSTNDGSITVRASGGTGTLMYSKDNGTTFVSGNAFTGLAAGTYIIVVKDVNGCTITLPAVTLSLPVITATLTVTNPNSCSASDGSITVNSPSGGTAPYVYRLNGGAYQNTATFSGLSGGTYTVSVRDAAGCELALSAMLSTEGGITSATVTPAAETSCGSNDGTITISNITGATGPYEFYIDGVANPNGINSNVFPGLAPDTYTIQIVASNSCIYSASATVNANCNPTCSLIARTITTPVLCDGATDGTAEVIEISGGSGSYEYSIDNGLNYQDSPVFDNLGSGVYTILVRDKSNKTCTASFVTPEVTNKFTVSGVIVVNQPKSCIDKGSIEFTNISGGVATYSFSINGTTFLSNTLYPGLDAGTYQATIKDANNCTFSVPVTIVNVPPITATATMVVPVSCNGTNDGKIKVENISGGTGTYVYSIDGTNFSGSPEFSNMQAGIHSIYVKDQNGSCINSFQVTVTEPAKLVADLTTVQPGSCSAQDGEIKLVTTSGGTAPFEYKLNNGSFQSSNTFTGLGGGSYTLTLRDAKGCTSTFTASLAVSNPISAQAIQVSPTSCNGESDGIAQINVTVGSGVYEFSKDGITYQAANTFTGLAAGNYILYVKDKTTACIASSAVIISGAVPITASIPDPINPSTCVAADGKIQINNVSGGTGPYQFSLDSLNNFQSGSLPFEFNGLGNGAYKVYIKDSKGCYGIYAFNLASPNAVVVGTNISITPATCKGAKDGKLDINPTGTNVNGGQTPYEYSLDGTTYQSGSLFTSLLASTYTVRVKDASGCVYTSQYVINEPAGLAFEVQEISGAGCGETTGSVKVKNIQGGVAPYSFSLNNIDYQSDSLFTGLIAGAYKMYVKDASGQTICENVKSFSVSGATPLTFKVTTENIGCEGGNKGKIIISEITGGVSAENTIRRFSINGGVSFRDAAGSEVIFDNLAPGIYQLIINYGKNFSCATTSREVRIISSGIPFTIDTVAATCGSPNGSATAVIPGGGNYFYSIDSLNYFQTPKFENLKPGLYKMYVKESANDKCLNIMPFIIPGPDSLKYDLIKENCFDIRLTNIRGGVPPYKVSLDGGATFVSGNVFANSYTVANLLTGDYNVVVVDSKGCATVPTRVKIDNRIVAKVKATLSMPDEPTGEIRITDIRGGNAPYEVNIDGFTWGLVKDKSIPIDTVITTLPMGKFTVYIRDASGCVKEYETEIKESKFMIPNVFTPNSDGVNDTFFIRNLPAGTFVTISNRWGKIIYSSKDYQNDWNGGDNPDGVYYYSLNIAGSGQFTGWVQIWR